MSDWTSGYVADIDYTYGYYRELNPVLQRFALLYAGVQPPPVHTACELGFGQGLSLNVHAAAQAAKWWGTDFNPAQASFARELAHHAENGAQLFDDSFAEFAARSDLPQFDAIGLHGIWSWISAENQRVVVDFIRRHLKVGGVLYISYNTLPGWAAAMPLRHLLTQHAELAGNPAAGIVGRINGALDFAEKLFAAQPLYGRANPAVPERLKKIKEQNRNYLAHEYFNRDWTPMHFAELAQCLEAAKLSYAASAHLLDHIDAVNLSAEMQKLVAEAGHLVLKETVRDFCVNQQFRRDLWLRGLRRLTAFEQAGALRETGFVLTTPAAEIPFKVNAALGEASLQETVYRPVIEALAEQQGAPRTLEELMARPALKALTLGQLTQALAVLTGAGHAHPVQSAEVVKKVRPATQRLNRHLLERARHSGAIGYLASPVTGGAVAVGRFQQLFLLARASGRPQPEQWAQFVWEILAAQGQKIVKEGKTLETAEENLAQLRSEAQAFAAARLPLLAALGVA
ncbi:MAG: class I SAM-dependent methyltransferase [Burkholderiales bacterium]